MKSEDARAWIVAWFRRRRPGHEITWDKDADTDFFREAWVDSFGVMELIEECERDFGIRFGEDDLGDASFATMSGLARLIERRRAGA